MSKKQQNLFFSEAEWEFLPEKILFKSNKCKSELNWSVLQSFDESKKYFFCFIDSGRAYIFPKKIFSKKEISEFRKILQERIKPNL